MRRGAEGCAEVSGTATWVLEDRRRGHLLAVRDRLGAEALYYARVGSEILLSKSVASILDALPTAASVRLEALAEHLCGDVPESGYTFWAGVHCVPPGHFLRVTDGGLELHRYWRVEPQPVLRLRDAGAYGEAVAEAITRVALDYVPSGPTAVALSSGLDSTSLAAALVRGNAAERLSAFVWTAPELPEADEAAGGRAAASALGLPVREIRVDDLWPLRVPLIGQMRRDGPLCNIYENLWNRTYRLARSEGIEAIFTGGGGDELFGVNCYSYPDLLLTGRWLRLLREMRGHLAWSPRGLVGMLRSMLWAPLRTWAYAPTRKEVVPWLREPFRSERESSVVPTTRFALLPGRVQRMRILRNLPFAERLVELGQRAAAMGVELLHPLLDHRLIELAASLPTEQTFRAGEHKAVLREAFRAQLPDSVLRRRGKTYPTTIAWRGLRERGVDQALDLMTDMRATDLGLVDETMLRSEYQAFLAGRHSRGGTFWSALTLEAWLRSCH